MSNKVKLRILYGILALSIVSILGFGAILAIEFYTLNRAQSFFGEIAAPFMPRPIFADEISLAEPTEDTETQPDLNLTNDDPSASFIDFDLHKENFPNIVGWIQSEGTNINYPIVQFTDNDFYLHHLPDGTRNRMGSIFLDYRNASNFSDLNIIIYGHDTPSGDKFGSLRHYRDENYFRNHDTMFIFTPEQDYIVLIFAAYILDSAVEVPPMHFTSEQHFDDYIQDIRRRSNFTSDVQVMFEDRLVFLATCVPAGAVNDRFIIVGKMLPI